MYICDTKLILLPVSVMYILFSFISISFTKVYSNCYYDKNKNMSTYIK